MSANTEKGQGSFIGLPDFLNVDEVALLKRTVLSRFNPDEQDAFVRQCQRTRLDPFTHQIYATRRFQKVRQLDGSTKKEPTLVPVTGIQGLTAVADRTGQYDGCEIYWCGKDGKWREEWLELDPPAAAKCKVYRKDRSRPEIAIARWDGFAGTQWDNDSKRWILTDFWEKMPDYMLAKCAKAAALRGAFPDQLSNLYIREELDSNITEADSAAAAQEKLTEAREKAEKAADARAQASARSAPASVLGPAPAPAAPETANGEDDLEMGPGAVLPPTPPTPQPTAPLPQPTAPLPQPTAAVPQSSPVNEAQPDPTWWQERIIKGIENERYHNRKIGSLSQIELYTIETQWIPAVLQSWDEATDVQKEDLKAFQAAIAFSKVSRPW